MKRFALLLVSLALLFSACSVATPGTEPAQDLATAENYTALFALIQSARSNQNNMGILRSGFATDDMADADGAPARESAQNERSGKNYSETNIQVEGVDEADIIKTDGRYLYLVANNRLIIVDVEDSRNMRVTAELEFSDYEENDRLYRGENPIELYLDPDQARLTLIISGYSGSYGWRDDRVVPDEPDPVPDEPDPDSDDVTADEPVADPDPDETRPDPDDGDQADSSDENSTGSSADSREDVAIMPMPGIDYFSRQDYVSTLVYDISNRENPQLLRQFSQEGYYLTSRKIGSAVYVVSNTYTYWLMWPEGEKADDLDPKQLLPAVREGKPDGEWQTLPADRIAIVPEGDVNNQLTLVALDTVNTDREADAQSLLGSSGIVYASTDHLYIAAWQAEWEEDSQQAPQVSTGLYRFRLAGARIEPAGQGSVPGMIINQFAMDEHKGYFRIATTTGGFWTASGQEPSYNHVYVLDSNLRPVGQVNDLAEGEQIKSVRFMGDQVYMVTFETVDPLFVIDLSEPTRPVVLGELKIPGYSTYLHPYAEGMLLGFGYDVDAENGFLIHKGLKVSLFDVSDFYQPREQATLILGSSGSYSELLYNHKSLLFNLEQNLIAFPAMLTDSQSGSNRREYGFPAFQGLVILGTDEDDQLYLRGQISHQDPDSDEKTAYSYYGHVQRAVTIDQTLYTFSPRLIQAHRLDDLAYLGEVELPGYVDYPVYPYIDMGQDIDVEEPGWTDGSAPGASDSRDVSPDDASDDDVVSSETSP